MADKGGFGITELIMALADIDWRFHGTISRGSDSDGHPVIRTLLKTNNVVILLPS
jgi:hypothetical protein